MSRREQTPKKPKTQLTGFREVTMLSFNEGKACDAIIRFIETRAKARRENICLHDKHLRPDRRIELTFDVGATLYAMEHTGIEPFANFMRMNGSGAFRYRPIEQAVLPFLPPNEVIHLKMPADALIDMKKKELTRIQDALARFVVDTAPTVPLRSFASYIGDLNPVTPPGVPFAVTLYRFHSPNTPHRFSIVHVLAGDADAMRRERIKQACDDKFPKLAAWKASERARTVLILEDNDRQLTNQTIVAEAFLPIALPRDDRPDETYVLMTCGGDAWYAWPLLIDGVSFFHLSDRYHPIHLEFDSRMLTSVTNR